MKNTGYAKVLYDYESDPSKTYFRGRLYDVDVDGQEEMIIYYVEAGESAVCEIWDAGNVDEQRVFQGTWGDVPGGTRCLGKLYVVRAEGATYLMNYHYVCEDDNALHEYWEYYQPVDGQYQLKKSYYAYHITDRKTLEKTWTYKIDGKEVTEEVFNSDPIKNAEDSTLIFSGNLVQEEFTEEDGIPWDELLQAGD